MGYMVGVMGQVLKKKIQKGYERKKDERTHWVTSSLLELLIAAKNTQLFLCFDCDSWIQEKTTFENWVDYVWPKRIFKKRYVKRENRKKLQEEYFEEKQLRCLVASSHCILISCVTCHSGWLQLWQHNMPGRGPIQPFCADFLKIKLTRSQCWWCRNTTSCGQH